MLSITPIENIFIDEFLPQAPSDYVKVYLYGLRQCFLPSNKDNDLASFARVLNLSTETVEKAFAYWARYRLVRLISKDPLSYAFNHIQTAVNTAPLPPAKGTDYSMYNTSLQSLFHGRMLKKWELDASYEWLDLFRLPEEVVMVLVQYCIANKGNDVSFKYIGKVAMDWAEKGIVTLEAAEQHIQEYQLRYSGAARILGQLGIRNRSASKDEIDLLNKWLKEYGFAMDAIICACKETTCIANPNMRYLDRVLTNMHAIGVIEKKHVAKYIALRQSHGTRVKNLFHILDMKDILPALDHFTAYESWTKAGFKSDAITLAARSVANTQDDRWQALTKLLASYKAKGLFTAPAIRSQYKSSPSKTPNYKQTNAHYTQQRSDDYNDKDIFLDVESLT